MKTRTFLKSLFAPAFAGLIPNRVSASTPNRKVVSDTDKVEFCLTFHSDDDGANYTIEVGDGRCSTRTVIKNSQPGIAGLEYDIRDAIEDGVHLRMPACNPSWGRHLCGRSDMFEQVLVRIHQKEGHYQGIIQAVSFRNYGSGDAFIQSYMEQTLMKSADLSNASKDYIMRQIAHQIVTRLDPTLKGRFIRCDKGTDPSIMCLRSNPDYVEPPEFRTLPPL